MTPPAKSVGSAALCRGVAQRSLGTTIIPRMSRGLAIETSGRTGSLAISEDGHVLAEEQFSHGLKHAAGIVPIIGGLCASRGWKPTDIEEIYVSAGPGSFTGLRVGITVEDALTASGTVKWAGGIDYNQFMDHHRALRNKEAKDLNAVFELESVIYSDGTREDFKKR